MNILNIKLKPLKKSDSSWLFEFTKDKEVTKYLKVFKTLKTKELFETWFTKTLAETSSKDFAIYWDSIPIGYTNLHSIDPLNKTASFTLIIGNRDFWGKGIGSDVTKKMVFYGFDKLSLNRISLIVTTQNKYAIKAYIKNGFQVEGIIRQAYFENGKFSDKVLLSILKTDIESVKSNNYKASSIVTKKIKSEEKCWCKINLESY